MKSMYNTRNEGEFPDQYQAELKKIIDLRYGENPNQPAALYQKENILGMKELKTGKSGMSSTNLKDIIKACDILKFFSKNACAVMKHNIPSGFAAGDDAMPVYIKARDCDARSAFGSVVVFNCRVEGDVAKEINGTFVEVVAAPSFDDKALELFNEKKNLRIIEITGIENIPKFAGDKINDEITTFSSGNAIVQNHYLSSIRSGKNLTISTGKINEVMEIDMLTAWYISLAVRSNAIVIVKDNTTIAISSGQQERVGAVEQALLKAYQKAMDREGIVYDPLRIMDSVPKLKKNPLEGAIVASDGFFPFRDSIDLLGKHGIKGIIQPGGSMRDDEVIEAAKEMNIAMALTKERCFSH